MLKSNNASETAARKVGDKTAKKVFLEDVKDALFLCLMHLLLIIKILSF